jgi:hypothetical protein
MGVGGHGGLGCMGCRGGICMRKTWELFDNLDFIDPEMNCNGNLNILTYLCILGWKKLHNSFVVRCSAQHPHAKEISGWNIPVKSQRVSLCGFMMRLLSVVLTGGGTDGAVRLQWIQKVTNNYRKYKYFIHTSDLHPICPCRLQLTASAMSVTNLIKESRLLGSNVLYFGEANHFHLQCRRVSQARKQKQAAGRADST